MQHHNCGPSHAACRPAGAILAALWASSTHDPASELPRIHLLHTSVNNDALASIVEGANSVERGHQVMADHGSKQRKPNFRTAVEDVKALATVFVMKLESVLGRRLMTQKTWSTSLKDPDKLDQLKLVYDY